MPGAGQILDTVPLQRSHARRSLAASPSSLKLQASAAAVLTGQRTSACLLAVDRSDKMVQGTCPVSPLLMFDFCRSSTLPCVRRFS